MVSLTLMYRRPKSLEVILGIRTAMSEEAGFDIPTFVEIVRTGERPSDKSRTVTRVDGEPCVEMRPETVVETQKVKLSQE